MKKVFQLFLFSAIILVITVSVSSCKKTVSQPGNGGSTNPPVTSDSSLLGILDSVYMYAHQLYFWNEKIPSFAQFNPSKYAVSGNSDSLNMINELFAFTVTYNSAINAATGRSYEFYAGDSTNPGDLAGPKYSYFEETSTSSNTSAIVNSSDFLDGTDYGFGIYPGIWDDTSLLVRYVETGSPFDNAGVKRGDRILSINNTAMVFPSSNQALINTNINFVQSIFNQSATASATFKIEQLRNGIKDTVTLTNLSPKVFTYNPVFKDTVLTASNGKKVGYIAYQSFTDWTKSSQSALTTAFNTFTNNGQNIDELVVDLRYNGGGYVETSENLANLIAPATANGKKMYTEYYNDTMTSGKAFLLAQQNYSVLGNSWSPTNPENTFNFSKLGSVNNLSRVIFLVSNRTASAAELLINNLKPYMNVVLIGTQWEAGSGDVTYGKPVGFFPIKINKYTYYIPEFATGNANDPAGGATYFNGMTVDNSSTDDARYDFGNPKETAIAQALYYISNGGFSSLYDKGRISNARSFENQLQNRFKQTSYFNGMIHNIQRR